MLPPALATEWHLESKRASRRRRSAHLLLRSPFPSFDFTCDNADYDDDGFRGGKPKQLGGIGEF